VGRSTVVALLMMRDNRNVSRSEGASLLVLVALYLWTRLMSLRQARRLHLSVPPPEVPVALDPGRSQAERALFLVVDAIPFDLARDLWRAGRMPGFGEPRPMVSVFPSLTHVAVPALLGDLPHTRPFGYEARYFHPPSGEVRGGLDPDSERGMAPYRGRPEGPLGHAATYTLTRAMAFGQIRWMARQVGQHANPWLGYLPATDGVAHFDGREALGEAVADIFEQLAVLRETCLERDGVVPDVVVCSDHGVCFSELQHLGIDDVARVLALEGYTVGPGDRGVHFAPMGDVGGGAAWCGDEHGAAVANLLASTPGIELAMAAREGGCEVFRVRDGLEHAVVAWRDGRFDYRTVRGDPLDLESLWRGIAPWPDAQAVLETTWDARYPCAPVRLQEAFTDLVQWPATVLFSMAPGWTFGSAATYAASLLRGGQVATHGALSRAQTLGFAASTTGGWEPGPLRPASVFAPWQDRVLAGYAPLPGD